MSNSSSPQIEQWLQQGIAAAKKGDKVRARDLLIQITDADEYNEQAWLWLSSVVDSDQERQVCLENVLTINPQNAFAQRGLALLKGEISPPPPAQAPAESAPAPSPPESSPMPRPRAPSPVVEPKLDTSGGFITAKSKQDPKSATTRQWGERPEFRLESMSARRELAAEAELESDEPTDLETLIAQTEKEDKKKKKRRRRLRRRRGPSVSIPFRLLKPVLAIGIVVALIVGVMALLKIGPFTPPGRGYADMMEPLLDQYNEWLAGSCKDFYNLVEAPCGPDAIGYWSQSEAWSRREALVICSQRGDQDCSMVQAFCGGDPQEMMAQVAQSAQETWREINDLWESFGEIKPPSNAPQAHKLFMACVRERMNEIEQIERMALGESVHRLGTSAVCQMFPQIEDDLREYMDSQ